MPPQLRMFMRMMFAPACQSLLALPMTYCESDEPSRPCTMMTVGREARTSTGCQWQWQRTWLAIWLPVAGETSTSSGFGGQEGSRRGAESCRGWSAGGRCERSGGA